MKTPTEIDPTALREALEDLVPPPQRARVVELARQFGAACGPEHPVGRMLAVAATALTPNEKASANASTSPPSAPAESSLPPSLELLLGRLRSSSSPPRARRVPRLRAYFVPER
ncbi:MAG TPA: hypothetical protein VGM90_16320 [Kofleriaceae bacterium]|jgi:hypothetical protein